MYTKVKNTSDTGYSLDAKSLLGMLDAVYELRKIIESDSDGMQDAIDKYRPMLLILMEYLALNVNNPNIDLQILHFLEKIFGKVKKKEKSKEEELGIDDELTKEEKKRRVKLAMYEIYKITNPRQLAGESSMENFVNNVKARGMAAACKYEGKEYAASFAMKEITNLESYKDFMAKGVKDFGSRGSGI